jgi:cephalosporin hydroxylase
MQFLVRLGKHDFKHDEECNNHLGLTSTPDCFDRIKLPMLSIH